jgi:crotonobetainyl-CoA:carnitine CoA-transferase CaiB-like acyl-CoA transferase
MPSESVPARALEGVRVLDFSIMLAGPYCTRLLAHLGADVLKVEPPEGDDMRLRAPLRPAADGSQHSAYFGQLNAGKRSLALDLKCRESIVLLHRLVEQCDVVVENFRPGVMDRLGLGYAVLSTINPRLVYCSISGYGQHGEGAGKAAYAMIVQAASGFDRSLMRYAGDRERPAPSAVFVADLLGGINGFAAIQTALVQRARTGSGQHVDVALMDGMLNLLVYELQEAQFPVKSPRPTYGPVSARDGDLLIAPITPRNFDALCEVTDLPELRSDVRFATLPSRSANWTAMMDVITVWTRRHTVAECVAALEAAGVPCAAYAEPGDTLRDSHLRERGVFGALDDAAGSFTGVNPPWQMSASPAPPGSRVPAVGEHTAAVLHELLGAGDDEIARLRTAGAFGKAAG